MIYSLVQALSLDITFVIQFALFIFMYPFMVKGIAPFIKWQHKREKNTEGLMEKAQDLLTKSLLLKEEYSKKAQMYHKDFNQAYQARSRKQNAQFLQKYLTQEKTILEEASKNLSKLKTDINDHHAQSSALTGELVTEVIQTLNKESTV